MRKFFFIITVFIIALFKANAQSIPVGSPVFDDYYRREQLLGKVDSNFSFTIRPLFPVQNKKGGDVFDQDSSLKKDHWVEAGPISFAKNLGKFQILPLTWQQQYNSDHPYGWNDGPMIPARGYQTMVSGGFYLKFGPLSVQLRPEFVYADNQQFNGFATGHSATEVANYLSYYREIDWPESYGTNAYRKTFLGQSYIRLTFDPISLGVSSENLWWGPGIRNSLILSNNAPGFKHITLNTIRPIKTYVGDFEAQIIAAHLDASNFAPLSFGTVPDPIKRTNQRYFTGININYHPKWVQGLTIGLIRTFDAYQKDVSGFAAYFPFFTPYSKQATVGQDAGIGDPFPRDQTTSMYLRWLFTKAQAEVYFEYGLNDNSYNLNDFIGTPDHSRAYLFGIRKMIPIGGKKDQHILVSGEITQLSQSIDRITRNSGGWYLHYQITEGHTNEGQILGAGTGSGGNLQSMNISWVSGLKTLGLSFDRYEHNIDFPYSHDIDGNSGKWVDFALGLQGEWNYKNLMFNAKIQHIKSLNYEWVLKDYDPSKYYIPHNDVYNLHAELGITFRF
ncbi:MAG: capsule assembly Wzi family protein [Mucilaginibacter sp.]